MTKETEPKLYEMCYMIDGLLEVEKAEEINNKIRLILDTSRNMVVEMTPLKLQKLAYPINKRAEAFWGWIKFMVNPEELANIKMKITRLPEVLRILIVEARREILAERPRRSKKKVITEEEIARTEEIDKKLEEILGT